jgi:hypothetical protein
MPTRQEIGDVIVTIEVRNLGQSFAHHAVVRNGTEIVHITREVPWGADYIAYMLADSWATGHGYTVKVPQ